jgi:hypothetical protein
MDMYLEWGKENHKTGVKQSCGKHRLEDQRKEGTTLV